MQTFQPAYYTTSTRYPESGTRIQLGNSYQFDAPPDAPDQRIFMLTLQGMKYFVDENDDIDRTYDPGRNLAMLEDFYIEHKRHTAFLLNHPVHGNVTVKFNLPLEIPHGIKGADGMVQEFTVELIEQP